MDKILKALIVGSFGIGVIICIVAMSTYHKYTEWGTIPAEGHTWLLTGAALVATAVVLSAVRAALSIINRKEKQGCRK